MTVLNSSCPVKELILQAQNGNSLAYNQFLSKMQVQIEADVRRRVSHKEDQEELVQMTLLKIHQYLGSYSGEGAVQGWVRTITKNVVFDFYKARDKKSFISTIDDWSDEIAEEQGQDTPENLSELKELISDLPTNEIQPLIENKLHGLSLSELAKRDGTTVANYKVKVHRAKKALIKYLSCFILVWLVRK